MRNFLSGPLLNFLLPCFYGKRTIMKITDICKHPFCCAIPLNICLVALVCYILWGQGHPAICSLKTDMCYEYHFKQITVIVINRNNNNSSNVVFYHSSDWSWTLHIKVKIETWKNIEERHIDADSGKCLAWGAIKEEQLIWVLQPIHPCLAACFSPD